MKKKRTEVFSVFLVHLKQKLHLIMRISLFVMLFIVLQAFAYNSAAQSEPLSITVENLSLRDVFRMIEDQSDYHFMYNSRIVDVDRNVSVGVDNMEVPEILDVLFQDTDIVYQIEDKQIALTTLENSKQQSRRERRRRVEPAEKLLVPEQPAHSPPGSRMLLPEGLPEMMAFRSSL